MRGCIATILLFLLIGLSASQAAEIELKMADGSSVKGELTAPNVDGVIIKIDGKLGVRTPWSRISQESLRELQKDLKLKRFVDPVIIPDPSEIKAVGKQKSKQAEVSVKAVDRPARITPKPGLFAGFMSPIGFLIFLSFWGTSVYAGYEIARFREHPVPLVCGVSALAPVIGPLVFLWLKPKEKTAEEILGTTGGEEAVGYTGAPTDTASSSPPEPEAPAVPQTQVFKRGEFTFNRRFIETKFAGFFRLVPGEAEKDLRLVFITARGEVSGRRISKVTANDLQVVVQKDDVFTDVTVPLNDILEIQVRHKDS